MFHPSLHNHFIIHPVLFILCLINVKRVTSLIIPVAFITRSSIESLTYYVWAMYSALWVIYSSSSRWEWWSILGYLFYVRSIRVSCVIFVIHLFLKYFLGDFLLFSYNIQHCIICRHSDSTVPMDAGIEPRTVATGALTVRRSDH